jgi:hypothetical protein
LVWAERLKLVRSRQKITEKAAFIKKDSEGIEVMRNTNGGRRFKMRLSNFR